MAISKLALVERHRNPFDNIPDGELADQLAEVKAQIAGLEEREKALKGQPPRPPTMIGRLEATFAVVAAALTSRAAVGAIVTLWVGQVLDPSASPGSTWRPASRSTRLAGCWA